MNSKEAIAKMAGYVRTLANKMPAGVKAAETRRNVAAANRLEKLASTIEKEGHLIRAVDKVYADKSAAYRHRVVTGLVQGFKKQVA